MGPEAKIEKAVCDYAKEKGMLVYKFTSPARRSVPDRLFIPWNRPVFFIEFKAPGGKPTPKQQQEINKIKNNWHVVHIVDSVEEGKRVIDAHA